MDFCFSSRSLTYAWYQLQGLVNCRGIRASLFVPWCIITGVDGVSLWQQRVKEGAHAHSFQALSISVLQKYVWWEVTLILPWIDGSTKHTKAESECEQLTDSKSQTIRVFRQKSVLVINGVYMEWWKQKAQNAPCVSLNFLVRFIASTSGMSGKNAQLSRRHQSLKTCGWHEL